MIPAELSMALEKNPKAREIFFSLPPSHRNEHAKYVAEAVKPETRQRRAEKTIEFLLKKGK